MAVAIDQFNTKLGGKQIVELVFKAP